MHRNDFDTKPLVEAIPALIQPSTIHSISSTAIALPTADLPIQQQQQQQPDDYSKTLESIKV